MLMTRQRAARAGGPLLRLHRPDAAGRDGRGRGDGNKPAVLVDGDASMMMHLAEFDTAVRYKMPLLVVVLNNEALGSEYYKLDAHKMDAEALEITDAGPGRGRRAFGGRGTHARRPSRS